MSRLGFTHESPVAESNEWYTPRNIFEALALTFDLDVASPGADLVPWIPAKRHLTIADDGLSVRWEGRVWCNPPYGPDTIDWMRRFARHRDGVALVFARTDTAWFHEFAVACDAMLFVRGRVRFISPKGKRGAGAGAGSLLLAQGTVCVKRLELSELGHFMPREGP